jgi:DNA-directed RNA polymerase specialized sigma24 family protein
MEVMEDFESWYRSQHPRVLAACAALCGDLDTAREATDEAFTRALERWSSVAEMVAPGGWVQTVALNVLRRSLRRRRLLPLPVAPPSDIVFPDAELWAAVRSLPHRQQTAVVLRYVHDLPEAQVAAAMSISRGTVASTLAAARSKLGRALSDPIIREEPVHG